MGNLPRISDNFIEIHDPELDPVGIMNQIRERLRKRREELGHFSQTFPAFGAAACLSEPEGEKDDADLYFYLRCVNDSYYQLDVEMTLIPFFYSRIPLIGLLLDRLRYKAHSLVLFYVNKLAHRQVTVNRFLVSTLNRVVKQIQEQQRQIQLLEEELRALRERS
jgi:hypothetical protein